MKNKIFIAIDTKSQKKARLIISQSKIKNYKIGYKFGLEFFNSKNGRNFISKLKKCTPSCIFITTHCNKKKIADLVAK